MMEALLRINKIGKSYFHGKSRLQIFRDFSLDVGKGEFICLLGPSGCGKSTLLNLVAGFERPDEGSIHYGNRSITGPTKDICMLFQEDSLFEWLTVEENIAFGPKMQSKRDHAQIAERYLEMINLERFRNAYPNALSGGMKKKVAIARALASDPEILLMDEPFNSIDMPNRVMLHDSLLKIWEQTKKTIIFVTHNVTEAIYLSQRIVLLTLCPARIERMVRLSRKQKEITSREHIIITEEFMSFLRKEMEARQNESRF